MAPQEGVQSWVRKDSFSCPEMKAVRVREGTGTGMGVLSDGPAVLGTPTPSQQTKRLALWWLLLLWSTDSVACRLQWLWCVGLGAPWQVGSSQIRDQISVHGQRSLEG